MKKMFYQDKDDKSLFCNFTLKKWFFLTPNCCVNLDRLFGIGQNIGNSVLSCIFSKKNDKLWTYIECFFDLHWTRRDFGRF